MKELEIQLLRAQIEVLENSLTLLKDELQNNISQLLTSTKMMLGVITNDLSETADIIKIVHQILSKAINDIRIVSNSITKDWLNQFNVIDNLNAETKRINNNKIVHARLHSTLSILPLLAEKQVMLFCIIQNTLQHIIKPAQAKKIDIFIKCSTRIEVIIKIDSSVNSEKTWIKNKKIIETQYRAELLGGKIEWNSKQYYDNKIRIILPLIK